MTQIDQQSSPLRSFAPVARSDARVLILGSMPGMRSLQQQQYYAHPRNAFWPILAQLCGFDPELPYPQRLLQLQHHQLALWDVLAACRREGSLDSAIDPNSMRANDFTVFFAGHSQLHGICFNGGPAEQFYRRLVLPQLTGRFAGLPLLRLPSTSPSNARLGFAQKLDAWRRLGALLDED